MEKVPSEIEKHLLKLEKLIQENELWIINPHDHSDMFFKLEKILDKIEKFPFSLNEFERIKRSAYEIISPEEVKYIKVYKNGKIKTIYLNKKINDAMRSRVKALVNSSFEKEKLNDNESFIYSGLPIRKAKGRWLRNFLLKYFY